MSTQRAIVVQGKGQITLEKEFTVPDLPKDYIRAKVSYVSLNPTDWKHADWVGDKGRITGCDFSGVVTEVGPDCKASIKEGDKICSFVNGSNADNLLAGAFAESTIVKDGLWMPVPESLGMPEASSLGVGMITNNQALYQTLGLPLPLSEGVKKEDRSILIYGASTATGTLAVQFAKLSGLKVIGVCSPRNFDLVKGLGADSVYDYNDADAAKKIREATNDKLTLAFDTISEEKTAQFCADALTSGSGAHYTQILGVKSPRSDVKSDGTLGYTASGEPFTFFGNRFEAKPTDYQSAQKFLKLCYTLFSDGKLKPHPIEIKGEMKDIIDGLDLLRKNKVSGQKLTYKIAA